MRTEQTFNGMSHFALWCNLRYWGIFFTFFLSNTTSSWFCIKSLKFKINHNHKFTSSASRSNSRSCRQRSSFIFLLAHSSSSWVRLSFNCLSTPTGKQSLLFMTLNDFFHVFFSILLSLQIGSSDNIHPLFTCFSPWSLIITFLLSLLYHYIWYTYTTHAVGIKLCRDDSKHVFINKELLSLLNKS